jgi:hypothetical protein
MSHPRHPQRQPRAKSRAQWIRDMRKLSTKILEARVKRGCPFWERWEVDEMKRELTERGAS